MEEAWELAVVSEDSPEAFKDWSSQHTRLRYEAIISSVVFFLVVVLGYQVELPFLQAPTSEAKEGLNFAKLYSYEITLFGTFLAALIFNIAFFVRSRADALRLPDIAKSIQSVESSIIRRDVDLKKFGNLLKKHKFEDFSSEAKPDYGEFSNYLSDVFDPSEIEKSAERYASDPGQNFGLPWKTARDMILKLKNLEKKYPDEQAIIDAKMEAQVLLKQYSIKENYRVILNDHLEQHFHNQHSNLKKQEQAFRKYVEITENNQSEFTRYTTDLVKNGLVDLRNQADSIRAILRNAGKDLKKLDRFLKADRLLFAWYIPACFSGSIFSIAAIAYFCRLLKMLFSLSLFSQVGA